MTLASILLAIAGFAAIAMATPRLRPAPHWLRWGKPAGFALLTLSCVLRLGSPAWRIALVEWVGELTLAALLVLLLAAWRPQILPWLGNFAIAAAVAALVAYSR